MNTIAERFDYARRQRGLSLRVIGELFSISGDAVRKSIERNNIKDIYINTFSDKYLISKEWLLTGDGEIFKDNVATKSKTIEQKELTGYYYPEVSASAGLDTEIENVDVQKVPVNIPGWGTGVDFINVYGDSMYPKFCSGEIIGIKEVAPVYVNYGYAYVVVFNDGQVFVKYIKKGKDAEHWVLASENPRYEDKEYHLSLIRKVYIVKGVITKTTM